MLRALLTALTLLPLVAVRVQAQTALDGVEGAWAIGSTAACARSRYELTVLPADTGMLVSFRDRAGRVNRERVDSQREDGFTTTTVLSPDVPAGTRWDYAAAGAGAFMVRNLSNGRQFALVRCPSAAPQPASASTAAPTFSDPVALIAWLIGSSGGRFDWTNDAASANVFSPGLRAALRAAFLRSRQRNEPPCGADGNIILATQDEGRVSNLRLSAQPTEPDRVAVVASFDVDGYHRDRRYMTVNLDSAWKLENIIESDGSSLRRSLDCRR